jgi:anti-sigma regulatory factor (Ser/Thr protein kinase)
MSDLPYRRFVARMDSMAEVRDFIDAACNSGGLGREDCLRLQLIVEELFTNTVMHGYGGDSDAPVWISLEPCAKGMALAYEDEGPPHDPLGSFRPMETSRMLSLQPVGGLGVKLIRELAVDVGYRRYQGRNCIRLTFPKGAARE